jgi:YjbE family integral membrane protein
VNTPALVALFQVILIDIVLAGDNAIVIGLVAARVPKEKRRNVIVGGLIAAVILRVLLASVTMKLLDVIGLMLAGGILLLWVAWRLWREMKGPDGALCAQDAPAISEGAKMRYAIIQIAAADLSMSLDNVLAVAGAAMHHFWVLCVGLALSITLMGVAAHWIAHLLNKHRWIAYAGLFIVIYVALMMIARGWGMVHAVELISGRLHHGL